MAHKKGQGSSRNGRDSQSQRRGVKRFAGEQVLAGKFEAQTGKPDRLVAQFVRCPFDGGHAVEVEKRFGDLAIAGLLKPCVECAKCED